MFANSSGKEITVRVILIAGLLLGAFAPTTAYAKPSNAQGQEPTATPTQTATETPTTEPTATQTVTAAPSPTLPPVESTPTQSLSETATSTPTPTQTTSPLPEISGVSAAFSVSPNQAKIGDQVRFTLKVVNNGKSDLYRYSLFRYSS